MKFAYLIMAHNNPYQLEILLKLLDNSENDIYLHIDKKNTDIDITSLKKVVLKAKLNIYKIFKVYHADISQTKCQIFLLQEAIKDYHDYYHLISNADLPIKSNSYINDFFLKNKGKQFVHFEDISFSNKNNCIYYYYFFYLIKRVKFKPLKKVLQKLEKLSIYFQKKLKIHRNFFCGANWFSITHELATDFCQYNKILLKKVRWTISSDELILQTFINEFSNVQYKFYQPLENRSPNNYDQIMRKIDWNRGNPYVWKNSDFSELLSSNALYARKFDILKDDTIIINIIKSIKNNDKKL